MENSKKTPARKSRATTAKQPLFSKLSALNVNANTEKRNNFTYLSWAWAWSEFKKHCPDANYEIIKDPETNKPYMVDEFGILVQTRVTTGGETHDMWLPVMDNSNNAQKSQSYDITFRSGKKITVAPASMMDINKALMRCLVKNLAMFGLGIYIYAGEDLPDGYVAPTPDPVPVNKKPETKTKNVLVIEKEKINSKRFNDALNAIKNGAYHEDKLRATFALSKAQENTLVEFLQSQINQANEIQKNIKK